MFLGTQEHLRRPPGGPPESLGRLPGGPREATGRNEAGVEQKKKRLAKSEPSKNPKMSVSCLRNACFRPRDPERAANGRASRDPGGGRGGRFSFF